MMMCCCVSSVRYRKKHIPVCSYVLFCLAICICGDVGETSVSSCLAAVIEKPIWCHDCLSVSKRHMHINKYFTSAAKSEISAFLIRSWVNCMQEQFCHKTYPNIVWYWYISKIKLWLLSPKASIWQINKSKMYESGENFIKLISSIWQSLIAVWWFYNLVQLINQVFWILWVNCCIEWRPSATSRVLEGACILISTLVSHHLWGIPMGFFSGIILKK